MTTTTKQLTDAERGEIDGRYDGRHGYTANTAPPFVTMAYRTAYLKARAEARGELSQTA